MEFFCYHRDRQGSMGLRRAVLEQQWGYMDDFADRMVARGPTFADDGTLTGSVHIVDLPDVTAARAFAFDEPGYQAGVYRDVVLRRWRNVSRRKMWDFVSGHPGRCRYLVLGLGCEGAPNFTGPPGPDVIAYGPLFSDDARMTLGTAVLLESTRRRRSDPRPRPGTLRGGRGAPMALRGPAELRRSPRLPASEKAFLRAMTCNGPRPGGVVVEGAGSRCASAQARCEDIR